DYAQPPGPVTVTLRTRARARGPGPAGQAAVRRFVMTPAELRAAGRLGGAASLLSAGGRPAGGTPGGNLALAALNAIAGDQLGPDLDPLAIRMAVRVDGRDAGVTSEELAAAFPDPTPRLAGFVPGLAETEDSWQRRGGAGEPYGPRPGSGIGYFPR